jgi:hypothetical protein
MIRWLPPYDNHILWFSNSWPAQNAKWWYFVHLKFSRKHIFLFSSYPWASCSMQVDTSRSYSKTTLKKGGSILQLRHESVEGPWPRTPTDLSGDFHGLRVSELTIFSFSESVLCQFMNFHQLSRLRRGQLFKLSGFAVQHSIYWSLPPRSCWCPAKMDYIYLWGTQDYLEWFWTPKDKTNQIFWIDDPLGGSPERKE